MSSWSLLGIEPTSNKKEIKQAYASLLKSNRPDDNPKGFSELHQAYKECLRYQSLSESSFVDDNVVDECQEVTVMSVN